MRRKYSRWLAFSAGACFFAPLLAMAQQAAKEPSQAWRNAITVNAFAEASYGYNFNRPDSGLNSLRVFDFDDRSLKLDVAELVIQRPVKKAGEFGFRVDATAGESVPQVAAAYGLFRDRDTGQAHDYDVHQLFLSWKAPIGKGLQIDAGKFITPFGYEVIDGYDGYNDNQSRSFLFGYAVPFTHTGVRATYPFSDKVSGAFMVVQGWDDWKDNNSAKSFGAQLLITPSSGLTISLAAMKGPEQKDNTRNDRCLYEVTSAWKLNERMTLGLDVLYGSEQGAVTGGTSARWSGAACYARWAFTDRFAVALRAEVFDDSDGARTGTAQTLKEATLTPEWKLGKHFVLRGDLRLDGSSAAVFEKDSRLTTSQPTVSIALLFVH